MRNFMQRFWRTLQGELRTVPEVLASNLSWFLLFFVPACCIFGIGAFVAAVVFKLVGFAK